MLAELSGRLRAVLGRSGAEAGDVTQVAAADVAAPPEVGADVSADIGAGAVGMLGAGGFGDAIEGRRVLIFTMNSGGHLALARGIEQQIKDADPTAVVKIVDGFSGPQAQAAAEAAGPTRLQRGISKLHEYELRYTPWTYDAQHAIRYLRPTIRAERAINTRLFGDQVREHIADFQPDVIVSTHERVTSPLGAMRRSGELQTPTVAALFDSDPHGMWLAPGIDQHIVYNRNDLDRIGAVFAGGPDDTLRAVVARAPVDQRAFLPYDRTAVRESFGLPADKPVALVSGGSAGYAVRDEDMWRLINETDFHIAVAAGRNEALVQHIAETFPADRVTAIPYTKEMPSLVSTSDVALLNANGATSAEAFAAGTPVVVFNAMAGHGKTSARAIDEDHLATYATNPDELVDTLRRVAAGDADIAERASNASALYQRDLSYGDVIVGARLAT